MDEWKKSFVEKLGRVQSRWATQFEETIENAVLPVYERLTEFLRPNGFKTSVPMHEGGRRSFKFELTEDAYLLLIFRAGQLGAFELSCEAFVPGDSHGRKLTARLSDLDPAWAEREFQRGLSAFIDLLGGEKDVLEPELTLV